MTTCVSCGLDIPDGQGRSCSRCYGDIDYGRDGYARAEWEAAERAAQERRYAEEEALKGKEGK
jgi:hypothetical protein